LYSILVVCRSDAQFHSFHLMLGSVLVHKCTQAAACPGRTAEVFGIGPAGAPVPQGGREANVAAHLHMLLSRLTDILTHCAD